MMNNECILYSGREKQKGSWFPVLSNSFKNASVKALCSCIFSHFALKNAIILVRIDYNYD